MIWGLYIRQSKLTKKQQDESLLEHQETADSSQTMCWPGQRREVAE